MQVFSHKSLVTWEFPSWAQWVQLVTVYPDDLSYTLPKPTWWKKKTQLMRAVLWPPHVPHGTRMTSLKKQLSSCSPLLVDNITFLGSFSWFLYYVCVLQLWHPGPMTCFSEQYFLSLVITRAFCTLDWDTQSHNSLQSLWSLDWSESQPRLVLWRTAHINHPSAMSECLRLASWSLPITLSLRVQGLPELHSDFQASLGYG